MELKVNGLIVGHLNNGVYVTNRTFEKHLMKMYNGFGISEEIIMRLDYNKCKRILFLTDKGDYLFKFSQYLFSLKEFINVDDCQVFVNLEDKLG